MSLDVSLKVSKPVVKSGSGVFIRENGKNIELTIEQIKERFPESEVITEEEFETNTVFDYNITHNLGLMATDASPKITLFADDGDGGSL